jgi:hypothetical protein
VVENWPPLPVVVVLAAEVPPLPVESEPLALLEAVAFDEPPLPGVVVAVESPSLAELDSEEATSFSAPPQPKAP